MTNTKVVVKLNSLEEKSFYLLDGIKIKKNPLQAASSIKGVVSIELNSKDNMMTITGAVDPVDVAKKLRKWYAKIETVGPTKEEKPPADDKEGDKKKEEQMTMLLEYCKNFNNAPYIPTYPIHPCYELENPNGCVIC